MRRTELIKAVTNVRNALLESGLTEVSGPPAKGPDMRTRVFKCLVKYKLLSQDFKETEHQITKVLGIDQLEEQDVWIDAMLREEDKGGMNLIHFAMLKAEFFVEQLSKIIELLETDAMRSRKDKKEREEEDEAASEFLTVIIITRRRRSN